MKNVLHIIESSETGGAESVFLQLISKLNNNYKPYIILFSYGWLYDELIKNGLSPVVVESNRSFDVSLITSIVRFIKNNNIDLVHSHLFGSSVYAGIASKLCRTPMISTLHGAVDVSDRERLKKLKYWLFKTCSKKIIFVSKYLKDYFIEQRMCPESKAYIIYNGIDTSLYNSSDSLDLKKEFSLPKNSTIVGLVGDIRKAKGYDVFLKAASKLYKADKNLRFVVAGSETPLLHDLIRIRNELDLESIVHFIGYRNDIPKLMKSIDIYLLTSVSEGFSLTTIEAMSSGCVVVATRCGGPEEIITDGYDGFLIENNNYESIYQVIVKILSDDTCHERIALNAKKTVDEKFSLESMIKGYENTYQEILSL